MVCKLRQYHIAVIAVIAVTNVQTNEQTNERTNERMRSRVNSSLIYIRCVWLFVTSWGGLSWLCASQQAVSHRQPEDLGAGGRRGRDRQPNGQHSCRINSTTARQNRLGVQNSTTETLLQRHD